MDYEEASDTLVGLVNGALDAGLDGRERPEPLGLGPQNCTDALIGPTSEVSPAFSYTFHYSALGIEGSAFAESVTANWRAQGMAVSDRDRPRIFRRYAISEDGGYQLRLMINEESDQISIGGSGPCTDPPD